MTTGWQAFIITSVVLVLVALVWVAILLTRLSKGSAKTEAKDPNYADAALEEVSHIFNDEFREELRNHGRLYFEKIISENAMFLKQDLDMTITQLNEYLKKEITTKLNEEFVAYSKAMQDAQQLALSSLQKSATSVEEQRAAMAEALKKNVEEQRAALIKIFEDNMAKIVEHYILQTLGDQFDLKSQMPYIVSQMEANKQKIVDDMRL